MELVYSDIRDCLTNTALTGYSNICLGKEAFRHVLVEVSSVFGQQKKYRMTQRHRKSWLPIKRNMGMTTNQKKQHAIQR